MKYRNPRKSKRHFRINVNLIEDMFNNCREREFSVFMIMKASYSNGCIYNYTQKSAAAKTGLKISSVRKYVKEFIDMGWCKKRDGNLIFNSFRSFDSQNKQKILKEIVINKGMKVKDILSNLHLLVFKKKQDQFNRFKKLGGDIISTQPNIRYYAEKLAEKIGCDITKLPKQDDQLKISVKNIGNMFSSSKSKGAAIIKALKKQQEVICIPGKKTFHYVKNAVNAKYLMQMRPNSYFNGRQVVEVQCNSYIF